MKKPILVFLSLSKPFLKALRLVAPTIYWSSLFNLLTTVLKKKCFQQSRLPSPDRVHLIVTHSLSKWPLVPLSRVYSGTTQLNLTRRRVELRRGSVHSGADATRRRVVKAYTAHQRSTISSERRDPVKSICRSI